MAKNETKQAAPVGYAEAMREVESILAELDSSSVDVDTLASKVERASFLIHWCNERIAAAQMTVDALVAEIDDQYQDDDDEDEDDDSEEDE